MATTASKRSSYLRPLLALVLIVAILYVGKAVIMPLALAVLLTFVLTPVVSIFQRGGLRRVPAVLVTVLLTFTLFGLVGWIVGLQVQRLAQELPQHRKEISAKIAGLRESGEGPLSDLFQMFRDIGKEDTATKAPVPKEQVVVVKPEEPSSFEQLTQAAGPILEPLAQAGLVVILVIFMLSQREDLRNRIIGLLGHGRLTGTTRILMDSAQRVGRLLLTQLLINVGFGVLFAAGLFFIGVPFAFLWGFLAVVLRFVPYIGSWVAVAFPFVLAFAIAPSWTQPILVLAVFVVLELVTANVVEPLLIGHGTGVSPIALLVAAAFWSWVWGPVGLVLSTPMTVCLVVLGQHVPRFQAFALLLGDKPALEPHVSFYQRLLAHDEEEAKQVAIEHAQTKGAERVYDDVVLPALALARRDRQHQDLDAADVKSIFEATRGILDQVDFESSAANAALQPPDGNAGTTSPAEKNTDGPAASVLVFGCPSHHEVEELSLVMLARLLRKDAYQIEILSTRTLPAEVMAKIEQEKPALVFIAILPPGGLVQARYLCKRLRKGFPRLPIVVGYWGDERRYDQVLARLRGAGASYVTTSLLQARSQIQAMVSPVSASPESESSPAVTDGVNRVRVAP